MAVRQPCAYTSRPQTPDRRHRTPYNPESATRAPTNCVTPAIERLGSRRCLADRGSRFPAARRKRRCVRWATSSQWPGQGGALTEGTPVSIRGRRLKQRARRSELNEDWSEAAKQYRGALVADPGDATSWYRLGRVLAKQKAWASSAFALQSAIALRGGSASSYFHLGRSLQRAGAVEEARRAYQQSESQHSIRPTVKGKPGQLLSYQERLDLAVMPKASYAYLLFRGASLAKRLGIPRITAVELGVAGGNGLLAMERHAATTEKMTGIGIDVFGFDTGKGLVAPKDTRDLPYRFAEGTFAMDVAALTSRLKRAELVLGDAVETFREFMTTGPAPLGAVSFDMDLYAPTEGVLKSMNDHAEEARFLPRVPVYFDDVVGNREQDYNVYTGELLAIEEFNQENPNTKLVEDRHFKTLPLNFDWHHSTYTMHRFGHPQYDTYIRKARPDSLALKDR
jgi:hypothetical protein